jgi:glycosyltransferase involved in cell wall biosynthesis
MNLLMLSGDTSVARGREGAFDAMLRRFARYWERIDILTPYAAGGKERGLYGNIFVHPSPYGRLRQPWYIRDRGAALMAERPYALITSHDFGFFYNGIGAAWLSKKTGVPYVSEIHHVEGYPRAVTGRERIYRALAGPYIRFAKRRAAAFRTVNAVEVPTLLRSLGVPDEKILVLPSLYIDFDVFRPLRDEPHYYDVVAVGRLVANKGLPTLIDAIARVKNNLPKVRLGILGRGPLERDLREQIAAVGLADNVDLHTDTLLQEDVVRFYNSGKMLVCASTAEGGPRVTVEAMACAVPVISTPVGVMPELIDDGRNGLLFNWDADALAGNILLLLSDEDLRQRMGNAGREAVQPFQADAVIERYARGYQELVERVKRNAGG